MINLKTTKIEVRFQCTNQQQPRCLDNQTLISVLSENACVGGYSLARMRFC